jgi:molecular chaperone GrpE
MHKDKVEELKQALKAKKEAESVRQASEQSGEVHGKEEALAKLEEFEKKLGELEEKLNKAETQAKENNDKFIRLYAEFENYRKRMQREKEELTRHAQEQIIKDLLPVLDDLERALSHKDSPQDHIALIKGVELVKKHMITSLAKFGLAPFESLGEPFDPHIHEAVSHQESLEVPPDTVVSQFRKGYLFYGKLIRPALVAVAKQPGSADSNETGSPLDSETSSEAEVKEPIKH